MARIASSSQPASLERRENGPAGELRRLTFPALGTRCEVQYAAPGGDGQASAFERAAVAWVEAFESKYSRFRADSLLSRINAAAGREWVEIDAEPFFRLTHEEQRTGTH